MKKRDLLLALLVVIVWEANFTVIKLGLAGMPPMLLAALRYIFAALPVIIFVKRPSVRLKYIIAYGITVGFGQFACLFYAMKIGMPAGISSVILQSQAFFTAIFAAVLLKESLNRFQVIGLLTAGFGLCLIGGEIGVNRLSSIPFEAFLLTLIAAAFWGISNIIIRYASKEAVSEGKTVDMLSMVVWSSLISALLFLITALLLDTPKTLIDSVSNLNVLSLFSILYLSFCATLFGYGMWNILLEKYPTSKVAPLSLLVPITGLITSQIVLNEKLSIMQWLGGIVIILGLVISNFLLSLIQQIHKFK